MNTSEKLNYLISVATSDDDRIAPTAENLAVHDELLAMILADGEVKAITDAAIELNQRRLNGELLGQLVSLIQQPTAAAIQKISPAEIGTLGGWTSEDSYVPTAAAATQPRQDKPIPNTRFGLDGDHVYFQCPQAELPSGLCFITLVRPATGVVTTYLAKLKLIGGYWRYRSPLLSVLKEEPKTRVEAKFLIPADDDTRAFFQVPEVLQFVQSLPRDDPQFQAAAEYLGVQEADDE